MTTTKQHAKSLRDANSEAQAAAKGRKGIEKRVTTFKGSTVVKDGEGGATGTGALDFAPMEPTAAQLAKINTFTRSPKTADQLVVFPTLSCNDLIDRDDERFTTDTVKGFAKLPDPLGPVGKSYMVGHDYTKLPVGRIFDASVGSVQVSDTTSATFLKNWVYVPKTEDNRQFIDNLDFGINWAVSVGVMLESSKCALPWCGADMYSSRLFGAWCEEGHDKGYFYTADAEKDKWGYYEPCDPSVSGAVKCTTDFVGAKDFFELSQVFLGAQFYAALDGTKAATAKGIVKAASTAGIPVLGLSRDEADLLKGVMPHMDARAVDAVRRFGARLDEDGVYKWTDDQALVWSYDPEDSEVMCLGKAATADEEVNDGTATSKSDEDPLGDGPAQHEPDSGDSPAVEREGAEVGDGGIGSGEEPEGAGSVGDLTNADDNSGKEAAVSKAAVVKALRGLTVPDAILRAVEDAEGDTLDTALRPLVQRIVAQDGEIATLTPKAALGDEYIKAARADAIAWYVKANQTDTNQGVNTSTFERMLSVCGDDVALIKELADTQKTLAQAKFPAAVRRSSFPTNPNEVAEVKVPALPSSDGEALDAATQRTVNRIHG